MAVVLVNKERTFDNPIGFIPGVLETPGFPSGIGGMYLTRRNAEYAGQDLVLDGAKLQESIGQTDFLDYDGVSVGQNHSRDGFKLEGLPVDGEDGITLFFVYDVVNTDRFAALATNVATEDEQNTGGVNFATVSTGSRIFLGADGGNPPSSAMSRDRVEPIGYQYDAFGFNVNTKEAFISNRYGGQGGSGWTSGTISDISASDNSSDYYIFRAAQTGYGSIARPGRLALFGWYPRTLSQSENAALGAALIPFMESLDIEMVNV